MAGMSRTFLLLFAALALVATSCGAGTTPPAESTAPAAPTTPTAADGPAVDLIEPAAGAQAGTSVWIEELTSPEIASRIAAGATTVLVPTGGTEQNGPHMALGKHNVVVAHTTEQIAQRVGNVLVAPVMAYVPEGNPDVMDSHLAWAGTISVPDPVFSGVLEATAKSLAGHGFTLIVFVGDSGGNQGPQQQVAVDLTAAWAGTGVRVATLDRYYGDNGQTDWLVAQGETTTTIGTHAGLRDTSELLAVRPDLVRIDLAAPGSMPGSLDARGVDGDPSRASAKYGATLLELKIAAGVEELIQLVDG